RVPVAFRRGASVAAPRHLQHLLEPHRHAADAGGPDGQRLARAGATHSRSRRRSGIAEPQTRLAIMKGTSMGKQIVYSPKVVTSPNPHSQATLAGNHFYTATVALDAEGNVVGIGDIEAQTTQALTNLVYLLEAAGGTIEDVVRVMVYLSDMRYF